MYVDIEFYLMHDGTLSKEIAPIWLEKASSYVDVLTLNRIKNIGFENLHVWQQTIIQQVVCSYADWLHENEDLLNTCLKNYAINGVNMTMEGAWNVHISHGVAIRADLYSLLETTGACTGYYNWGRMMHFG